MQETSESSDRSDRSGDLLVSYLTLRKMIGILGMSLPFILAIGALFIHKADSSLQVTGLQDTISHYYYTDMREAFVGILFAIGLFLFAYKGYDKIDDRVGDLACLFALGVAFFPTAPDAPGPLAQVSGVIHLVCAGLFLSTLAWFSYFIFTKSGKAPPTPRKKTRNTIYRTCGLLIAGAIVSIGLVFLLKSKFGIDLSAYKPVFWLESLAVVAFGFSWWVKGEAILAD
jgi:hypothetical protein